MELECVSFITGKSLKGTEWVMFSTANTFDKTSGKAEFARKCLMLVISDNDKKVAADMCKHIDSGKPVLIDEKFEMKNKD
tara:strand:+ start:843 stop:1082 length:240 start_codon:yes stop_codon:yes gene_type:complete